MTANVKTVETTSPWSDLMFPTVSPALLVVLIPLLSPLSPPPGAAGRGVQGEPDPAAAARRAPEDPGGGG